METGSSKKSRMIPIISVVLAMLIVLCCLREVLLPQRCEYDIVLLGDSNIGNIEGGEGIDWYIEQALGRTVLKGGFGGTSAGYDEDKAEPANVSGQLSLVRITRAIAHKDFAVQKAQIAYGEKYHYVLKQTLGYFQATAEELSKADFEKADYVVIEHGVNDYNSGRLLDNPQDKYDETTFGGALRSSIENLQRAYPNLEIILMTPTWCMIQEDGQWLPCDSKDFGGGVLEDYVEVELQIAQEYGLWVLDNYHDSGIGAETQSQYLSDGLHLNSNGRQLIAERLADLIRGIEE